jgi:hypothetical protein
MRRKVKLALNLLALQSGPVALAKLARHAAGRLTAEEASFVPASERAKVYWTARAWLAIFAGIAAWCLAIGSILPATLVGLDPAWHLVHKLPGTGRSAAAGLAGGMTLAACQCKDRSKR